MRPVSGFERPAVQWIFVAIGVLLITVAAGEVVGLHRMRAEIEKLRAANTNAGVHQEQLENQLTREQATREALALELARIRTGASTASAVQPTLTLMPLAKRGAQPPEATVAQPDASQLIELRLVLPPHSPAGRAYAVAIRSWSGGQTVWSRTGLSARMVGPQRMVTASVTGDVFSAGAYEVALSSSAADAGSDVAFYELAIAAAAQPRQP